MDVLYAQFIGAAALLTIILSVQCRKKKNVMFIQMIANVLYSFQYILLGAYSAAYLNIVTIVRSLSCYEYDKRKKKYPIILTVIFSLSCIVLGYIFYDGALVIIPVTITIAYTVGASFKDPNVFRKVFLMCSFIWMYYNFKVGAYVSVFGNVCEVISTSIALKRYSKK